MKFKALSENVLTNPGRKTHARSLMNRKVSEKRCLHSKCMNECRVNMIRNEHTDERQARRYILSYLLENPDAGDTLEGIVEWWLLHQKIRFETRNVSQAISELVAEGLIVTKKSADSRIIYRANRSSEEIQAMLGTMRGSSDDDDS